MINFKPVKNGIYRIRKGNPVVLLECWPSSLLDKVGKCWLPFCTYDDLGRFFDEDGCPNADFDLVEELNVPVAQIG